MRTSINLLSVLLSVVLAQDPPCPYEDCRILIDSSACYNGAVGRRNKEELFRCVPDGQKIVCNCWGCDMSLIKFINGTDICPPLAPTPSTVETTLVTVTTTAASSGTSSAAPEASTSVQADTTI